MKEKITEQDFEKAFEITNRALSIVMENVVSSRKSESEEIIKMAENYLKDSRHFFKKGNLVNAFGAVYYAHGWIDCGVRLGIFEVDDDSLFTLR